MWEGLAADWVVRHHHSISFAAASNARAHAGSLTPTRFFFYVIWFRSPSFHDLGRGRRQKEGKGVRDGSVGVTHLTIVTRAVSLPLSLSAVCVCVYSISTGGSIFVFVSPPLFVFVCFNLLMSRHPRLYIEEKSWFFDVSLIRFFCLLIVIFELFLKFPPCFWLKNELEK
jgi:hypothetical protein